MKKENKEIVDLSSDELMELWGGLYHQGNSYELNEEVYTHIKKIDTSRYSDGPSWDYIIQRKSDGKYFKFNVWNAGDHNGYVFEDKFLEEVFPVNKNVIEYE